MTTNLTTADTISKNAVNENANCNSNVRNTCLLLAISVKYYYFTEKIILDCIMGRSHNNFDSCNEAGSVERNATCISRDNKVDEGDVLQTNINVLNINVADVTKPKYGRKMLHKFIAA